MSPINLFAEGFRKPARAWLRGLVIWVLVSLACASPLSKPASKLPQPFATPSSTEEISLAATNLPAPTVTPVPLLPPTLVEVAPLPGSYLSAQEGLTFYFSQPMERASVEGALRIEPELAGSFEWLDDATVRFRPSDELPLTTFSVRITTAARGANGLALAQAARFDYRTADFLRVVQQLPLPRSEDINPAAAVVVSFNQPVVPLTADTGNLPAGLTLTPAATGRGEWVNTSTYIFYPQPPLRGGQRYTVEVNPQLVSSQGTALDPRTEASLTWTFETALPRLVSLSPVNGSQILPDQKFTLVFNQPMDQASLEQNLKLEDMLNNPVAGSFEWSDDLTHVSFKPDVLLVRSGVYRLRLSGRTLSQGGAALGSDLFAGFQTVGALAVERTNAGLDRPLLTYSGYGEFDVTFNAPLKHFQNLAQLVSVQPEVAEFNIRGYAAQLYLTGFFEPDTVYTITFAAGLRDRWDQLLSQPITLQFRTAPARPALWIYALQTGAPALYVLPGESRVVAQVANLTTLDITSNPLALEEFIRFSGESLDQQRFPNVESASRWQQRLQLVANRTKFVDIPLTPDGSQLAPGLYAFRIQSPELAVEGSFQPRPFLAVVSRVHLAMKHSADQVLIWAVDLVDNRPVVNARISFYNDQGALLATAMTDMQGVAQAKVSIPANQRFFAMLGQPGDEDFSLCLNNWSAGLSGWNFGYASRLMPDQLLGYLYTDRPIYRPGQTVYFRAVVRQASNGRYSEPGLEQITVNIYGAYPPEGGGRPLLATLTLPLSAFGTGSGSYTVPDAAPPGEYLIEIDQVSGGQVSFQVAAYRKPEVELQVEFSQPELFLGQDLQATLRARYYFGAPAGDLPLRWSLYAAREDFYLPGYQTGIFNLEGPADFGMMGYLGSFVTSGSGKTQTDGSLVVQIQGASLQEMANSRQRRRLTLEVTIDTTEEFPVSSRASVILHPEDYYIGIRSESWSGETGKELGFTIQTVDLQRNPSGNHSLQARFQKVAWQYGFNDFDGPQVSYTLVSSADFSTDGLGRARLSFIPPEPGTYLLEVNGQTALSQALVWVGGKGAAAWPRLRDNRIQLVADAAEYAPGQTAHIFVPNPLEGAVQALVTVERGKVMEWRVISIAGPSYDLALELDEEDAPNVYVSVLLLGQQQGLPAFRLGYQRLAVDPLRYRLNVRVISQPQRSYPGGTVRFTLQVKDSQGKPVQGEFSLALVDKAVLALADPNAPIIERAFYGIQPLGVFNSLPLVGYAGRTGQMQPGRGGGGGEGSVAPVIREEFKDTAYWNGEIVTDANGVAEVAVSLPDNLTTWVVTVRGLTRETQVGEATAEIVTTKDLLLRPFTPRFLVEGDHVLFSAVVQNNTQQTLNPQVTLQAVGVVLDDPAMATQQVSLSPGGRLRVSWWGTVQSVDEVDLVFSAQAGALQDATRPQWGALPVLHYSAPQTFGTAGVLTEAGERLEVISLPRSFTPTGGKMRLEIGPSLAATIVDGLKSLERYPTDFTEPLVSRLWPEVEMILAMQELRANAPSLRPELERTIAQDIARLVSSQNPDGGWGWSQGRQSERYLTSYLVLALYRASQAGFGLDPAVLNRAGDYLKSFLSAERIAYQPWEMDQFVFQYYVLQETGIALVDAEWLYTSRDLLSPWAKALLALKLANENSADPRVRDLISELQSIADRTAGGVSWQDRRSETRNFASVSFTTAVVTYALLRLYSASPEQPLINDAVQFLALNRRPLAGWGSSYDTAWALVALIERMRLGRDLRAGYQYSVSFNGEPLASGQAAEADALTPVSAELPLSRLRGEQANLLRLARSTGDGQFYYRVFLNLYRPAETVQAMDHGLSITRRYYRADQDCRKNPCHPINSIQLGDSQPVILVRLTLTLQRDLAYVVVEDTIPAGAEILDVRLKTAEQGTAPQTALYNALDPFAKGWGWWYFNTPQVYDDHVRWIAEQLPAGTYELVYRLLPLQAGKFRLIPAHAYQYYFPTVEGSSAGEIFTILP